MMRTLLRKAPVVLVLALLAVAATLAVQGLAGDLDPPGPPGKTMHTLSEIWDKLDALAQEMGGASNYPRKYSGADPREYAYMDIAAANQGRIEGSVEVRGLEGWILVFEVDHRVYVPYDPTIGQATGGRLHEPFKVTKQIDKATPKLYRALATGEHMKEVQIRWYRTGPQGAEHYYTVRLIDAMIVSIRPVLSPLTHSPAQFAHAEEVSFIYERIRWTWERDAIEAEDSRQMPKG